MITPVLDLKGTGELQAHLSKAASIIDAGGLVAFPTETVYGIGCRCRSDSIRRLDQVKGRAAEKRYTLHIADKSGLSDYVPHLPLRVRKLIDRAWPGPLTVVFELDRSALGQQRERLGEEVFDILYRDSSIGIRCPDHVIATVLLRLTRHPVVAPSANPAGLVAPADVAGVLQHLDGQLDLVIDGGPCRYGRSSTVARITAGQIQVIREGVYKEGQLVDWGRVRLLFVCTGNTCRSAMAEGLCRHYLAEALGCNVDQLEDMGYSVISAGIIEVGGLPASAGAQAACAARGVDLSMHKSRVLTAQLIRDSDLIFVMDRSHRSAVLDLEPAAAPRCMLLDEQGPIPDPIGQPAEVFDRCANQIQAAIERRIKELVL